MFAQHILLQIYQKALSPVEKVKLYILIPDLRKILSVVDEIEHILKTYRLNREYREQDYRVDKNDLVFISFPGSYSINKRLINEAHEGVIYHVINKKANLGNRSDYSIGPEYIVAPIPKRYKYSSGLNSMNGYH